MSNDQEPGPELLEKVRAQAVLDFVAWVAVSRAYNGSDYRHGQPLYNTSINAALPEWAVDWIAAEAGAASLPFDVESRTEWRVESETLEDEFDTKEDEAREWLERCRLNPDWEPAVLMSRRVLTITEPWAPHPQN